ncbi:hypothetical protein AAMO2058_000980600 [Amorphochlora amoebiformis]|mmetsp:Transcript_21899/g.34544  ORF Transcript_21899/g.34544 Transcript_21899/m.34544 type:complete len:233 (-) Transcript_21899:128-826(-)
MNSGHQMAPIKAQSRRFLGALGARMWLLILLASMIASARAAEAGLDSEGTEGYPRRRGLKRKFRHGRDDDVVRDIDREIDNDMSNERYADEIVEDARPLSKAFTSGSKQASHQQNQQSQQQRQTTGGYMYAAPVPGSESAQQSGPFGVPIGTWVIIGLVLFVLIVFCIIARIYLRKTIQIMETCCYYSCRALILPFKLLFEASKIIWYPIKESCIFCCKKRKEYYNPWSITS